MCTRVQVDRNTYLSRANTHTCLDKHTHTQQINSSTFRIRQDKAEEAGRRGGGGGGRGMQRLIQSHGYGQSVSGGGEPSATLACGELARKPCIAAAASQ